MNDGKNAQTVIAALPSLVVAEFSSVYCSLANQRNHPINNTHLFFTCKAAWCLGDKPQTIFFVSTPSTRRPWELETIDTVCSITCYMAAGRSQPGTLDGVCIFSKHQPNKGLLHPLNDAQGALSHRAVYWGLTQILGNKPPIIHHYKTLIVHVLKVEE